MTELDRMRAEFEAEDRAKANARGWVAIPWLVKAPVITAFVVYPPLMVLLDLITKT